MNYWTLNKIKNRLFDQGFYRTLRIPSLHRLGVEIFAFIYGCFPSPQRLITDINKMRDREGLFSGAIYAIAEHNQGFGLAVAETYTNMKSALTRLNNIMEKEGSTLLEFKTVLFSFNLSNVFRFFDYAPILRQKFQLPREEERDVYHDIPTAVEHIELSPAEKTIYHGLIKYPDTTDSKLSEIIGVNRQKITRAKRNFEGDGLFRIVRIPDLKKIGFEVLTFGHITFKSSTLPVTLEKHAEYLKYIDNVILAVMEETESVFIGAFETFRECKKGISNITENQKSRELFKEEPEIMLFSMQDLTTVLEHGYEPIVRKVLQI